MAHPDLSYQCLVLYQVRKIGQEGTSSILHLLSYAPKRSLGYLRVQWPDKQNLLSVMPK